MALVKDDRKERLDRRYENLKRTGLEEKVVTYSSLVRILGERSTIHSPRLRLFLLLFKVEISSRKLISLFTSVSFQSGSAS